MEQVHLRYPGDREGGCVYSLALTGDRAADGQDLRQSEEGEGDPR
jgi:hypothetical protein